MSPIRPRSEIGSHSPDAILASLRAEPGLVVLTGGQTGVDTLAARAALAAGLPVHVAFPRGMRQEDGSLTPERLAALRGAILHELPAAEFAGRTWTCVGLADAVMLIDPAGGDGCAETVRAAGELGRPLLDLTEFAVGPSWPRAAVSATVMKFLGLNSPRVLMFAGCRGSLLNSTETTAGVAAVLETVMSDVAGPQIQFGSP